MNESIQKFEDYLRGEMSQAELASFEIERSLNPELDVSFSEYQMIRDNVGSRMKSQKGETALKGTLTKLGGKHFKEQEEAKRKSKMISFRLLRFAALFVFFLCTTGIIYIQFIKGPLTPSALADKHYVQTTLSQVRSQAEDSDKKELYDAFNKNNYDLVDKLLVSADQSDPNVQVIIASQYYQKNEFEKSYKVWKKIADQGKGEYEDRAIYNMALNQLKLDNATIAKQHLEYFSDKPNSYFAENASEILQAINRTK